MSPMSKDMGWKFPVRVDKITGRIMMAEDEEDIHEAILIIVKTAKKERMMRPEFGSNIRRYIFEENSSTTLVLLAKEIKSAIINWEPRVSNVDVTAYINGQSQESVMLDISYIITSLGMEYKKTIPLNV